MTAKIIAAITAKSSITLFLDDGNQEILQQESFKTQEILDQVLPELARQNATGNVTGVELDLGQFKITETIKELTGGAVTATQTLAGQLTIKVGDKTVDGKALVAHIERAKLDGSKGFANFMRKFGEIKRQHTCDELLKFMENADLPIADDGSIIGYKVLRADGAGVMVDGYTAKVKQRLGSLVYMPDSKVDDNRRQLCSTGLHIAARDYINGYGSGERKLCLVKIQPKDVVAVPIGESTKMRVAAYHIVKVLSEEDAATLQGDLNASIYNLPKALALLSEVVGGDHTPIIERVEVGAAGEHKVTPIAVKTDRIERRKKKAVQVSKISRRELTAKALKVDPKDIRILNKLIARRPHLADQEPAYLKKLIKAQRMLDDGKSLRTIGEKLGVDRERLGANLIRNAA